MIKNIISCLAVIGLETTDEDILVAKGKYYLPETMSELRKHKKLWRKTSSTYMK